jgi:hypothetical protein
MKPLPPFAQEVMDAAMSWMDARFDATAGLLRIAGKYGEAPQHIVRESTCYALGLLARGEDDLAAGVLRSVLAHQIDDDGTPYHGTFLRYRGEPHPQPGAVEWRDYDPNWRDFICTGFALVLISFEERLPQDVVTGIERSFRLAVEGTLARRVRPGYTNIALMDAYLLYYAGMRLGEPGWCAAGVRLAQQIYDLFVQTGAFEEYNSPTYYGTDLYALALWRGFSASPLLRRLGAWMEEMLWRDIAAYYHAGLRNVAGPFDRSYGMDMTRYAALLGLWIWLGVGRALAPFPDTTQPFDHSMDVCFGTYAALAGTRIPSDARAHFQSFQGERQVEHSIAHSPARVASAWLGDSLMLGAEFTSREKEGSSQFHPLTIHWRAGSGPLGGPVGWAKLVQYQPVDVRAGRNTLELAGQGEMVFRVYSPAGAEISPTVWSLDGLRVTVEGANPQGFHVERTQDPAHPDLDVYEIHYEAEDDAPIQLFFKITFG